MSELLFKQKCNLALEYPGSASAIIPTLYAEPASYGVPNNIFESVPSLFEPIFNTASPSESFICKFAPDGSVIPIPTLPDGKMVILV